MVLLIKDKLLLLVKWIAVLLLEILLSLTSNWLLLIFIAELSLLLVKFIFFIKTFLLYKISIKPSSKFKFFTLTSLAFILSLVIFTSIPEIFASFIVKPGVVISNSRF